MKYNQNNAFTPSIWHTMRSNIAFILLIIGLYIMSSWCVAKTLAITNAQIHTAAEQGTLNHATVVIQEGIITAINPEQILADEIIDAQGRHLTPGIIAPQTIIGLVEVNAVGSSKDDADKDADITFDPSFAFNPTSSLIPYTRKGGVTSTIIRPGGGSSVYQGLNAHLDLSGDLQTSLIQSSVGVYANITPESHGSRALKIQKLANSLADRQEALQKEKNNASEKDQEQTNTPNKKEELLDALLSGNKTLTVYANRASDLLQLIKLKQDYDLKMVIQGAGDAPIVAKQLALAEIPVIIMPLNNLPHSFDSLHHSLTDAAQLFAAGVKVIFMEYESHNQYQLRLLAGNAIANGVSQQDALTAITSNVATAYSLNAGQIKIGKRADLVLWDGDMFDVSGQVKTIWINGKEISTESRHDQLRERYRQRNAMPTAYHK